MKWWSQLEKNERTFWLICVGPLALNVVVSGILFLTVGGGVASFVQVVFFFFWAVGLMVYMSLSGRRPRGTLQVKRRVRKVREPKNPDDARLYN